MSDFLFLFHLMDFVTLHLVNQLAVIKQGKDDSPNDIIFSAQWKGVVFQRNLLQNKRELNLKHRIYHALKSLCGYSLPPQPEVGLLKRLLVPANCPVTVTAIFCWRLLPLLPICKLFRQFAPKICFGQSQPEELKQFK